MMRIFTLIFFLGIAILTSSPHVSEARNVTFSWQKNVEEVDGYRLYIWRNTEAITALNAENIEATKTVKLGDISSYKHKNLEDDATYHFALKAYRAGVDDSPFSDILRLAPLAPPSADFTITPLEGSLQIDVDASKSTGTALSYTWDFGDGSPEKSGAKVRHTYTQAAQYQIQLTVEDASHRISKKTYTIKLSTAGINTLPQAVISSSAATGPIPLTVTFDASQSQDPDGDSLSYSWEFGDGSTATGLNSSHIFSTPGTYSTTLTVRDSKGGVSIKNLPVIATQSSGQDTNTDSPTPIITVTKQVDEKGITNLTVFFSGEKSTPSTENAKIVQYAWNFGDGATATGSKATHIYPEKGQYKATLTIKDDTDKTAQRSISIDLRANTHIISNASIQLQAVYKVLLLKQNK